MMRFSTYKTNPLAHRPTCPNAIIHKRDSIVFYKLYLKFHWEIKYDVWLKITGKKKKKKQREENK